MSISAIGTNRSIDTGSGDDHVVVSKAPGLLGLLGLYQVQVNGQTQYMTRNQLEHTHFDLGSGDDTFEVVGNVDVDLHVDGGSGDDTITTGRGNDLVDGGSGDDTISTGDGFDIVDAGSGDDDVDLGAGFDIAFGGSGDDTLKGGPGWDLLFGGSGFDIKQYN
jgi:Ca2+-binding RTX toxin-like protein